MYPYKPCCCINDNLVLTENHQLVQKNLFAQHSLDALTHITIAPEYLSKAADFVPSLLSSLPADFGDAYNLEVYNEHCVRLIDKQDDNFTIMTYLYKNMEHVFDKYILIKKTMSESKNMHKNTAWIADVRFADYIVMYKA
jgi:hypothetical protein